LSALVLLMTVTAYSVAGGVDSERDLGFLAGGGERPMKHAH